MAAEPLILVNGQPIVYDRIPVAYMADGMKRYLENGIPPGSFMRALLCNDLMDACQRADDSNRAAIFEWASWLYNHAPSGSYGSREAYTEWLDQRRAAHAA